jgi:hypothetical protein
MPLPDPRTERAVELMARFAERTGLGPDRPQRRYLWTDAFAVCTFLGLGRELGDERHTASAHRLVDRVHHSLARHRDDDGRSGWISGVDAAEGEAHPTLGGVRIGKPLPERGAADPLDERLEWERDGQYFHYLTKWMHALDQVTRQTGQPRFNVWARELALVAHRAFTLTGRPGGRRRMVWKMSIDLRRPLVPSMGQHDPLDGLVTSLQLDATLHASRPTLAEATHDYEAMVDPSGFATSDPLGLGGLLVDAWRMHQLVRQLAIAGRPGLIEALLEAAVAGLESYVEQPDLRAPATRRLAFRELGLAIGLGAVELLRADGAALAAEARATLERLERFAGLRGEIEAFWERAESRDTQLWVEHLDINEVMLATSLEPAGYLTLRPGPAVS